MQSLSLYFFGCAFLANFGQVFANLLQKYERTMQHIQRACTKYSRCMCALFGMSVALFRCSRWWLLELFMFGVRVIVQS